MISRWRFSPGPAPVRGSCLKDRRVAPRLASSACRRGTVTLWTLLFVVVLLTILYVVVQVAQLWLAREKLENAIEAAALAAAKQWGDTGGGTANVRDSAGQG